MNRSYIDLSGDEEKNKHDHPIASREEIISVLDVAKDLSQLAECLSQPAWAVEPLEKRLAAMVRDQQLKLKGKTYQLAGASNLHRVRVVAAKSGQFSVEVEGIELLLNDRQSQGIFPNDEVVLRVPSPVTKKSIPIIVDVHNASEKHLVCRVVFLKGKLRLVPMDQRVKQQLVFSHDFELEEDTILLVRRSQRQNSKRVLKVEHVKTLGMIHDDGIERLIARNIFSLADDWPNDIDIPNASQEALEIEAKNRESWCHLPLVTIDGEDAKDFDDAVYAEKTDEGFRLYVAIADVSHYVQIDDSIDQEAKSRGNSVYLPGHVIPMLPEVLSNNLCSLMPEVNRLAMGCEIDYNHQGVRQSVRLAKVVIKSHARLTYNEVDQMIDGVLTIPRWFQGSFEALNILYSKLRANRIKKGTIILTSRETKFEFDDQGSIETIKECIRGQSHILIEECMLAANMAVGQFMYEQGYHLIYRCHNGPSLDKVEALQDFLSYHHITVIDDPSPIDLQRVLDQAKDLPDFQTVEMMILRTLSQAFYSVDDRYHYALSSECYTHFTSPIRRYADLCVHRAISSWIQGNVFEQQASIAANCTIQEKRADEASWYAQAWLKAKWVQPYIGQTFTAKIVSVTHFGLFVVLSDMPVEGLVHVSSLGGEFFHYQYDSMTLVGKSTGLSYGVGQVVQVILKSVDLGMQRVDFTLQRGDNI